MKSWISSILFTLLAVSVAVVAYLFSDHYEEQRLNDRVTDDLSVELIEPAVLIANKNYGGLEEGGDISILELRQPDCKAVQVAIEKSEHRSKDLIYPDSDVWNFLKANELEFSNPKTTYQINEKGNSIFYAINSKQCILVRDAYFE